ncbi:hypothetical protein COMA2_30284 [Candidatus Nitrospira nitrificans]|uniref:Uncharacterized protein n=1 Tax=Candidatus Nitrospira nitrificans TaxID=1742973 RepID=A0A0S4LIQ6_9BACT|nr:hypothetical protein COMA2_30284 [Candidatus Nitrospira nitrificans]
MSTIRIMLCGFERTEEPIAEPNMPRLTAIRKKTSDLRHRLPVKEEFLSK